MNIDIGTLLPQLGIGGAILAVAYKLALVFIERWGKVEDARTAVLDKHLGDIAGGVARIEGRLGTTTPPAGVPSSSSPSAGVPAATPPALDKTAPSGIVSGAIGNAVSAKPP